MTTAPLPTSTDPWLRLVRSGPEAEAAPAGPPPGVDHFAAGSVWPLQPAEEGRATVSLPARGRQFRAVLEPSVDTVRVHVELDRRDEPPPEACRVAAGRVLDAVECLVPRVHGVVRTGDDDAITLRLETVAGGGDDLDAALDALTAACVVAGPELVLLLDDDVTARRCLEIWPPVRLTPSH